MAGESGARQLANIAYGAASASVTLGRLDHLQCLRRGHAPWQALSLFDSMRQVGLSHINMVPNGITYDGQTSRASSGSLQFNDAEIVCARCNHFSVLRPVPARKGRHPYRAWELFDSMIQECCCPRLSLDLSIMDFATTASLLPRVRTCRSALGWSGGGTA